MTEIKREYIKLLKGKMVEADGAMDLYPDEGGYIRISIENVGGKIGGIDWDEDTYLVVDMLGDMDGMMNTDTLFIKKDAPEERNIVNARMIPMRRVKLCIKMDELRSYHYFTETRPGMYKGHVRMMPTHISRMDHIEWQATGFNAKHFNKITVFGIYATKELPDLTVPGEPMVDKLGQWIDGEWNTKTHSEEELVAYLRSEYEEALKCTGYPEGWSRYGGCKDVKFDATGYFHSHHDGKRWWLVDPDGYGFFSNGVCYSNRMGVHGFTHQMENLFSWLPDADDETYKDCWTTADKIPEYAKRNGVEKGKTRKMFNFARANMIRAFGPDKWWEAWNTINVARLKKWGFNTIGVGVNNYEDEDVDEYLKRAEMPFVVTLKNFPLTEKMIFCDFPDVYSEEFEKNSEAFAKEQLTKYIGNPYLIGYFVTNEPEWKFNNANIAERLFALPDRLASKVAMVEVLKEKYQTVDKLNEAWGSNYDSFDDLYTPVDPIKADKADLEMLHNTLLNKYAAVTSDALKRVDPDHMNFGMRYARPSRETMAGCEYYDAFSFNRYTIDPTEALGIVKDVVDMPAVIGEWHVGGGDKGLFCHGLIGSPNQEERGQCCSYYLERAMANDICVGAHYFEMNDQPLLGRFDGECMEHGIMDVCNRPYDELVTHFMKTNAKMYDLVRGIAVPTKEHGRCSRGGVFYEYED